MRKFQIEEKLIKIPLLGRIIKYNYLKDNNLKNIDIKYGADKRQYYRLYKSDNDNNKPIIYFIHGGGWWHGSPVICSGIGKYLCKKGYTTVLPGYRLVPKYRYPTQIEDIYNCFSQFIKNEDISNRKIVVMGYSAGGELGCNLVFNKDMQKKYNMDNNIFKGFISISGVLDFTKCTSKHARWLIANYVGIANIKQTNPINLIKGKIKVPVLCIHGDRDPLINIENSKSFIKKIKEKGGYGELKIIKGKHHSDITGLIRGKGEERSNYILEFLNNI